MKQAVWILLLFLTACAYQYPPVLEPELKYSSDGVVNANLLYVENGFAYYEVNIDIRLWLYGNFQTVKEISVYTESSGKQYFPPYPPNKTLHLKKIYKVKNADTFCYSIWLKFEMVVIDYNGIERHLIKEVTLKAHQPKLLK